MLYIKTTTRIILPALIALGTGVYADDLAASDGAVFYQIYVRAFYDSDGDGIGDFQGVIQKMDYLEELGVRGLWLMPLFRAPTDHKYFSSNFCLVDPEYGTNDDLRQLVEEAHRRKIKVIIDFMVNHTSVKHPWFHASRRQFMQQEAGREPSRRPKYLSFYHWAPGGDIRVRTPETYTRDGQLDPSRLANWKQAYTITGEPAGKYYSRFVDAPDLNYDNPEVREEIKRVGRYWLTEIGVDGFRLDAARHIYDCEAGKAVEPEDRNCVWWREFCGDMKRVKPDCILIAEIWSDPENMTSYLNAGMDSVYDFSLADAIRASVKTSRDRGIVNAVTRMDELAARYSHDYSGFTFLANHDFARLMTIFGNDESMVRLAYAVLLMLPGRPGIYYGDEVGLKCDRKLTWLAMPWDEEGKDPGQTGWMATDKQFTEGVRPVAEQSEDENSLYWHFKRLIQLRNRLPALSGRDVKAVDLGDPGLVAYQRTGEDDALLVLHNLCDREKPVELTDEFSVYGDMVYASGKDVECEARQLRLPSRETVILRRECK